MGEPTDIATVGGERNTALKRLLYRLDGSVNAVLVKDVRCWLRSRKFLVVFFVALAAAQLATIFCVLATSVESDMGSALFTAEGSPESSSVPDAAADAAVRAATVPRAAPRVEGSSVPLSSMEKRRWALWVPMFFIFSKSSR